jgi:glutathione synthase/RimK-type ligase-like ATP-grasp enzyme
MGLVIKKVKEKIEVVLKQYKEIYRPMIRSRHPSHAPFRTQLRKLPFRSVVRFGSLTELEDPASVNGSRVELNSREAIKNSSSKLLMKHCFENIGVKTADWECFSDLGDIQLFINNVGFPVISKSYFGSKGKGNTMLKTQEEFNNWIIGKNLNNYIFEKYYNYNKEYRLHVTKDGCFYTCRKMLRQEFREHPNSWQRHDDNCVWILEENENFDKPDNWNEIVEHCIKALKSCGLDFGACDLRVQNNNDSEGNRRDNPDFIVVEINSAPSMGTVTLEKYKEILPQLLIQKYNDRAN